MLRLLLGLLRCPPGMRWAVFERECRFFDLPESTINKLKNEEGIILDFEDDKEDGDVSLKMKVSRKQSCIFWSIIDT